MVAIQGERLRSHMQGVHFMHWSVARAQVPKAHVPPQLEVELLQGAMLRQPSVLSLRVAMRYRHRASEDRTPTKLNP